MLTRTVFRNKARGNSELHIETVPDRFWIGSAAHPITKAAYPLLTLTFSRAAGEFVLDTVKQMTRKKQLPEVYIVRRSDLQWEVAVFFRLPRVSGDRLRKLADYDLETILALPRRGASVAIVSFLECSAAGAEPFLRWFGKTKYFCLSLEVEGKTKPVDLILTSLKSELPPPYDERE